LASHLDLQPEFK